MSRYDGAGFRDEMTWNWTYLNRASASISARNCQGLTGFDHFTFIICHYFMISWFHFVRQVKLLGVAGMSVAHENHIESWDVCSAWDFFRVGSVHDAVHIRYPTYPTAVSCHRWTQDTGWHRMTQDDTGHTGCYQLSSAVQCCPGWQIWPSREF